MLVLGLGRSGLAATRLLRAKGAHVVCADSRDEAALGTAASEARALGAELRAGAQPESLASGAELVVVSPGVPQDVPPVAAARRAEVPVWGELELSARFCRGRIVAITGTNGKSTTTAMTGAILRAAGIPGGTGGNLGTPLADLLAGDSPDAVHAVEVSSFQLEAVDAFRATVGAVLNLTPDHLDRYPSLEAYARAKARLLETQEPEDAAVLNADDPERVLFEPFVRSRLHVFSTTREFDAGAFLREDRIVLRTALGDETVMDAAALPVPGEHNVANALAAALACRLVGCPAPAIAAGLTGFRALPHRLEHVATIRGIDFYNDSKATNLDAAERAVRAFPAGTIHVILGGKDKGADWKGFAAIVGGRVKRALLVGAASPAIRSGLGGTVPLEDCGTVGAAVSAGLAGAAEGEIVLLAPGCASFDQYRSFEERGDDFRAAVRALARKGNGHA